MRPRPPPALQLPSWEEAAHEWLAAADGDVDAPIGDVLGSTVLMAAAERGYTRLVEKALRRCAAVDRQNRCGLTALMSAAMEGQHAVAAALLAHGAAPHLQDHEGKTVSLLDNPMVSRPAAPPLATRAGFSREAAMRALGVSYVVYGDEFHDICPVSTAADCS